MKYYNHKHVEFPPYAHAGSFQTSDFSSTLHLGQNAAEGGGEILVSADGRANKGHTDMKRQ